MRRLLSISMIMLAGASAVGGGELAEALRTTLASDGFLAEDSASADYLLHATIRKLDRPWMSFTTTVTTVIEYVLVGRLDGREHSIMLETQGKAGMSDAFFGVHRTRIANEAAMRANIACLARHLGALDASAGFRAATNSAERSDCVVTSRRGPS